MVNKISSLYFKDTEDDVFVIMVGDAGAPEFQAIFDEKGKCISHQTRISFKDLSIMIARLKKAGYKLDDKTETWTDPQQKISCKINHYGLKDYYSLDFETIMKEKTKTEKKTAQEIAKEKEELNKTTTFAKNTFGESSTCSVSNKKGNCCGYECNESVFFITDGSKNIFSISTFDSGCDGKELVTVHYLISDIHSKGGSLEMIFDKIKKEIGHANVKKVHTIEPSVAVEKKNSSGNIYFC